MPDRVFLKNNGQSWKRPERRGPFALPGWSDPIPLGDRIEITDQMLRTMLKPTGFAGAKNFADFVAGVYNRDGAPEWLSVVVEPETTKETSTPSTDPGEPKASRARSKA